MSREKIITTSDATPTDGTAIKAVLRIPQFRILWLVLGLSSIGDWLGLLATSLYASEQVTGTAAKGAAFSGVIVMRLLPAILLGPIAGVFADRFDRRWTMMICDVLRGVLFLSIPLSALIFHSGGTRVIWALIATFLIEVVAMFWIPAKEAGVPNLIPKSRLEAANQLTLITTYGIAPVVAAGVIALLSRSLLLSVGEDESKLSITPTDLALYINACTFLVAGIVVFFWVRGISGRSTSVQQKQPSVLHSLVDGWRFVRRTAMVRGLVYGIVGAFAAGGAIIGAAQFYAASLSGGDATFGLMFGTLFIGLGAGLALGPMIVKGLSRRRWFGMSIVLAGASVALLGVAPHLAVALPLVFTTGAGAGMAYLSGMTLLGREVADEIRGRIFAFVQSTVRVVLMLAIAGSSLLVGVGGSHKYNLGDVEISLSSSRFVLMLAGFIAISTGLIAFSRMDDKPGVPVLADFIASVRGRALPVPITKPVGYFITLEGGEGAGKSTQLSAVAHWLTQQGYDVVTTREPGGTRLGEILREQLLHGENLSDRTETLLYTADRADHVARTIRPSLDRGCVVLCDRYSDSSLAYQAAGRGVARADVQWLSEWATEGLKPDTVVLLDIDPEVGLQRVQQRGTTDSFERESLEFHQRVRQEFLDLAADAPERYLVCDATRSAEGVTEKIIEQLTHRLPPPHSSSATEEQQNDTVMQ